MKSHDVPPQSGKRKQYRPPVSTDRGGIDRVLLEKRGDMGQDFRRELADGCEAVPDAPRLSQYRRDPQNRIVDLCRLASEDWLLLS